MNTSATDRLITQIKGVADKEKIIETIDYILDIKSSAKVTTTLVAPPAKLHPVSITDLMAASSANQPVESLGMLGRASRNFKKLFSKGSKLSHDDQSLLQDSPGGGGRKMRRRTRKMRIMRFRKSRTCRNVKNRKYTRRI